MNPTKFLMLTFAFLFLFNTFQQSMAASFELRKQLLGSVPKEIKLCFWKPFRKRLALLCHIAKHSYHDLHEHSDGGPH